MSERKLNIETSSATIVMASHNTLKSFSHIQALGNESLLDPVVISGQRTTILSSLQLNRQVNAALKIQLTTMKIQLKTMKI